MFEAQIYKQSYELSARLQDNVNVCEQTRTLGAHMPLQAHTCRTSFIVYTDVQTHIDIT